MSPLNVELTVTGTRHCPPGSQVGVPGVTAMGDWVASTLTRWRPPALASGGGDDGVAWAEVVINVPAATTPATTLAFTPAVDRLRSRGSTYGTAMARTPC